MIQHYYSEDSIDLYSQPTSVPKVGWLLLLPLTCDNDLSLIKYRLQAALQRTLHAASLIFIEEATDAT